MPIAIFFTEDMEINKTHITHSLYNLAKKTDTKSLQELRLLHRRNAEHYGIL